MKHLSKAAGIFYLAAIVIWATPTPSHAYLDAGSGSMMVQLLLAGTAGLAVMGKLIWHKVVAYCKNLFHKHRTPVHHSRPAH